MRRGDPERIYQAHPAGIYMRLTQAERLNELDAEHWISRWERMADGLGHPRGSTGYWDEAWPWIMRERHPGLGP